jgi:hypothetical protein
LSKADSSLIENLRIPKEFVIFMLGERTDQMSGPLEITFPFFAHEYIAENFFVTDFLVKLGFIHFLRAVGNWVQLPVKDLGENCTNCKIACVNFNHHGPNRPKVSSYGCLGKVILWHI